MEDRYYLSLIDNKMLVDDHVIQGARELAATSFQNG